MCNLFPPLLEVSNQATLATDSHGFNRSELFFSSDPSNAGQSVAW